MFFMWKVSPVSSMINFYEDNESLIEDYLGAKLDYIISSYLALDREPPS